MEKVDPATKKSYWIGKLSAGGKSTDKVLAFEDAGVLADLVRIEVSALGSFIALFTFSPSLLSEEMAGSSKTRRS